MIRHRAESPSPAVTDAELQADVMRFVAILALCLVAVSSLVDGYRASVPPEDDSRDPASPVAAAIGRMPASASSGPPSTGVATSTRIGFTCELPAPWKRGVRANSPTTATEPSVPRGRSAPW